MAQRRCVVKEEAEWLEFGQVSTLDGGQHT